MLKNIVKFKFLLALFALMIFAGTAKSITVTGTLSTTPPPAGPGYTTDAGTPPAVQGVDIFGLTTNGMLVKFNARNPSMATTMPITGVTAGETLRGIDFRPATGQLYAYGSNAAGTSRSLYTINRTTGVATFVAAVDQATNGAGSFGFDFNPTVDRIRVVNTTDENRRTNPTTGATINDGVLAYAAGDPNAGANPNIVAAGYTNSFGGATSTALYNIDSNLDVLAQQNPANAGTLTTIGTLGVNTTDNAGLDILRGSNTAFAALEVNTGGTPAGTSGLYTINLTTGAATFIAPINSATPLVSLTVAGNSSATVLDFDGDDITCYTVFRPENNTWYIRSSVDGSSKAVTFGTTATDVFTPGDYDGDGKTDISVWRTTNQIYYTLRSSDNTLATLRFGALGDEPVDRDYDGDGKTDHAVVRRTGGKMFWFYASSMNNGNLVSAQFGLDVDVVAPGDYDGDGKFDLAVRRGVGSNLAFYFVQQSRDGFVATPWGFGSDVIVPGDYDGDGKTDYTAVRQGTAYSWFIKRSSDNGFYAVEWGAKPMFTAQGDYDGDGATDITVWDPTTETFYVQPILTTFFQQQWGQNGDYPVANYDTH